MNGPTVYMVLQFVHNCLKQSKKANGGMAKSLANLCSVEASVGYPGNLFFM